MKPRDMLELELQDWAAQGKTLEAFIRHKVSLCAPEELARLKELRTNIKNSENERHQLIKNMVQKSGFIEGNYNHSHAMMYFWHALESLE
jgi:hypothetical protein